MHPIEELTQMAGELRAENERLRERNARLTAALKSLLLDTGNAVFAASASEVRAAEAALLADEQP